MCVCVCEREAEGRQGEELGEQGWGWGEAEGRFALADSGLPGRNPCGARRFLLYQPAARRVRRRAGTPGAPPVNLRLCSPSPSLRGAFLPSNMTLSLQGLPSSTELLKCKKGSERRGIKARGKDRNLQLPPPRQAETDALRACEFTYFRVSSQKRLPLTNKGI